MKHQKMKGKLIAIIALLLVCAIMLVMAGYAWLILSTAPEIVGVETNVGANGSLEMALLNNETHADPSLIRAKVGGSSAIQEITSANLMWGNVVDLSDMSYGLEKVSLLPSCLDLSGDEEGYTVSSNLLMMPNFGKDGRITNFDRGAVSAVYQNNAFTYHAAQQDFGVRGIGMVSGITAQQSALAAARAAVLTYTAGARNTASSTWASYGGSLFEIYNNRYMLGDNSFTDTNVAAIRSMATGMLKSLNYVDLALRQGIIGYASATIEDENEFRAIRASVETQTISLSFIAQNAPTAVPGNLYGYITQLENDKTSMQEVMTGCNALIGGSYAWDQIAPLVNKLLNPKDTYLGETQLTELTAGSVLTADNVLTVAPNSGIVSDIADYAGNFNAFVTYKPGISVELVTNSTVNPSYLVRVQENLAEYELPEEENGTEGAEVTDGELSNIYGYALDMAFRCNAVQSNLQLQTMPTQRIYSGTETADTQGGGSYMQFATSDLPAEQALELMDAVRVGFLDDRGYVLKVAKLNTSDYVESEAGIMAPLYLYEYDITVTGTMRMTERQSQSSTIVSLPQNAATVITVLVWLDGDCVENRSVAAWGKSMTGVLNLQFSSSADLIPSGFGGASLAE